MRVRFRRVDNAPGCPGVIEQVLTRKERKGLTKEEFDLNCGILIQLDLDYPGVASAFGWNMRELQSAAVGLADEDGNPSKLALLPCDHSETDGTVDCSCGVTASEFISAAYDYLVNDADGKIIDDPGYFE